jgi:integrase/recombinase XerD
MNTPEFIAYLKRKQFASTTLRTSETVIQLYFDWLLAENLEPEQVSYQEILGFIKSHRKQASQRTLQHYLNVIRHYYDHLIEVKKIEYNPAKGVEIKGVRRKVLYHILEPQELHQLYNAYQDDTLAGRRNKVMLGLLVYQGVKTEELRKLETSHVKLREGKVEIPGGRKSNHRIMNLESHQVMDVYDYVLQARPEILKESNQETDRLFVSLTGKASTISNLTNSFLRPLKAEFKQLKNAKQIRASVITKWLKQHNLRETQYLAGHKYVSTTESYQMNDMEGLKEEINQFHPL